MSRHQLTQPPPSELILQVIRVVFIYNNSYRNWGRVQWVWKEQDQTMQCKQEFYICFIDLVFKNQPQCCEVNMFYLKFVTKWRNARHWHLCKAKLLNRLPSNAHVKKSFNRQYKLMLCRIQMKIKTSNIHELQRCTDLHIKADCKYVIHTDYVTPDQFLNESTNEHDLVVVPLSL